MIVYQNQFLQAWFSKGDAPTPITTPTRAKPAVVSTFVPNFGAKAVPGVVAAAFGGARQVNLSTQLKAGEGREVHDLDFTSTSGSGVSNWTTVNQSGTYDRGWVHQQILRGAFSAVLWPMFSSAFFEIYKHTLAPLESNLKTKKSASGKRHPDEAHGPGENTSRPQQCSAAWGSREAKFRQTFSHFCFVIVTFCSCCPKFTKFY